MATTSTITPVVSTQDAAATRTSKVDSIMPHADRQHIRARVRQEQRDGTLSMEAMNQSWQGAVRVGSHLRLSTGT